MKSGHLEVVRSDGVEKRGPAVPCKWSVTRLWLVGCLASRLSPGIWLVTCLISIKTASSSWRPIGFRSESWPLILVSCLVSVALSRSPGLWLVSPGYLCHRGRGGRSWRLFAWSSASESLVLTTFCCCVLTLSLLLSLLLEVLHKEVESEVAENRYFVTETILTPGIQPLGSYDLVDDHQLLCLVSHVTLNNGKIVNKIFYIRCGEFCSYH